MTDQHRPPGAIRAGFFVCERIGEFACQHPTKQCTVLHITNTGSSMHDARPCLAINDPRRYDWQHVARRRSLDHAACLMGPLGVRSEYTDWR